jgi:hypothetical protein
MIETGFVMKSVSYESVLHLAGSLSRGEKLRLMQELVARTEEESGQRQGRSVLEFCGLGETIWSGVDAEEYVNGERAAWNG